MQERNKINKHYKDGISIFIPQKSQISEIEESLSLFYSLKEWGENVNIIFDMPDTSLIIRNSKRIEENNSSEGFSYNQYQSHSKKFTISINISNKEVENLRYEKNEKRLNLFISLRKGIVKEEDIVLIENQNRGEDDFLLLTPKELNDFSQSSGVQLKPSPRIKLLARVLSKTKLEKEKNIYSIILNINDFISSGAKEKDIAFVISELNTKIWKVPSFILLWEKQSLPSVIKGVFYNPKEDIIKEVSKKFGGLIKGNGVLFSTSNKSANTVKENIFKSIIK